MVKAGALYYAIFISFIVALLGGFFIMSIWMHHAHITNILTSQRLERNVHSAILLVQEVPGVVSGNRPVEIDLFNDGNDIVTLTINQWGGYCMFKASAKGKFTQRTAIALCGKDIFENEKIALYLADKEQSLSLSGNTSIKGDCFLPKQGLRRAYIEGISFSGKNLTDGKIGNSKSQLPLISDNLITSNLQYFNNRLCPSDSQVDINILFKSDTLKNSFFEKTLVLHSKQWITLSDKVIQGNIRIISSKGVTIGSSLKSNDIIVYAPKIEVEKGFAGNLQMFATDTIMIKDEVRLLFPSFIAITETQNLKALINIGKRSEIAGDVLLSVNGSPGNNKAECDINEDAVITGRVYCEGRMELKGSVNGTVYTNGFVLRTQNSIYENHLLNATINFNALPVFYCGSLITEPIERFKMVKWML